MTEGLAGEDDTDNDHTDIQLSNRKKTWIKNSLKKVIWRWSNVSIKITYKNKQVP